MDTLGTFLANYPLPPFFIALLLGVPSLILYAAEVGLLLRHWRTTFNSPFYYLFLTRAITSIANYFNTYVYSRFGRLGVFTDVYDSLNPRSLILAGTWFLNYHLFHSENISTTLILLNRFTAISYPLLLERIWAILLIPSILLALLGPLPLTWPILIRPYMTYPTLAVGVGSNDTYSIIQDTAVDPVLNKDAQIAALSAPVFCAVCILLNVGTVVRYRLHHRHHATTVLGGLEGQRRVESRLAIYAVLTFFSQLAVAVNVVLICVNSRAFVGSFAREVIFLAVWNWTPLVNVRQCRMVPYIQ